MVICVKRPKVSVSDLKVSSHDRVSDFYLSAWQSGGSPWPMLAVRIVEAVIAVALLLWAVHESLYSPYFLIFLTNWGLMLIAAMTVFGVLVSAAAVRKEISAVSSNLHWIVSTYWVLYNLSITINFVISLLYWILLFDPSMKKLDEPRAFWLDVLTHSLNSVLAICELMLSRSPCYFVHLYQPLSLGIWYIIFTFLYYLCGGTGPDGNPYIYELLDWEMEKKRSLCIVFISILALIVVWCSVYAATFGRGMLTAGLFPDNHDKGTPDNVHRRSIHFPDYGV